MASGNEEGFGIFLSWSGPRAKGVAQALREWLPTVLPGAEPWFSERDIPAGAMWLRELLERLERFKYGIACLTPENVDSRWMLLEAGAVSKALDEARLCPYLLDLEPGEVPDPLGLFQGKRAEKEPTFEMLESLNRVSPRTESEAVLRRRFERMWPDLEESIAAIPPLEEAPTKPAREPQEVQEELIETVRAFGWQLNEMRALVAFGAGERRGSSVPDWWKEVVGELKRRKQALTAAVYGEAMAQFDGQILWLMFPGDADFYVSMAKDSKHMDVMLEALRSTTGLRPSEVRVTSWDPS